MAYKVAMPIPSNTSKNVESAGSVTQYYRALVSRDARFDGVFFYGVSTTGIYCRPVCRVKPPKASSCHFFHTAAAAEQAGFRPCLRCRPELAPYALQQNLAHAVWKEIANGALNDGNVQTLAERIGLSARQLQRVMLEEFGVTPIALAQTQRLLFAKKLLQETRLPMNEIAFASGFSSVRRFNALFSERYHMAPSDIRHAATAPQDGIVLHLAYRPPYAWDALLTYLAGRAMPGLEAVMDRQAYVRSVQLQGHHGWLRVTHQASRQQIALEIAPSLTPVLMPLMARVRQQFDVEANPTIIQSHLQSDALLATQMQAQPGLRVPGAFDHFELAVRAVLGQQVSVAGATTVSGRLVQRFGQATTTPFASITHHFPTPQTLLDCSVSDIASLGMPASRASTVQHLAQFALAGGLEKQPHADLAHAIAQLKSVKGIGEWTAQYIAMRALRYPDAFPAGDLGLQKAAAQTMTDGTARLTEKQLLARANAWSPWRSYAALLLWQSLS